MINPKVSILVPVYKVEQYLPRCIDSVLSQDFQDWEMILVDDGSPDRCPQICDEYAKKDGRIKVVHKANGGVTSARYVGFQQTQGKYLVFVDADDWLMPHAITTLYNYAELGDYDIVRGCNRRVIEDGTFTVERGTFYKGEVDNSDDYLEKAITAEFEPYLWGALYRRDLFSKELFESMLYVPIGEDWLINIAIGKNVCTILCVEDIVYNYYINRNSAMQQQVCSFEYADRVKRILYEITSDASDRIKHLVKCNRMIAYIHCLFVPELPFRRDKYREVVNFLREGNNRKDVERMMNVKFLKFIDSPLLFYLHSRFYRILFKYLRLKGRNRKVLK